MEKFKKILIITMVTIMMLAPALSGKNSIKAQGETQVGIYVASIDWVLLLNAAKDLAEAFEDLFCPDDPQNRCKNGVCSDGACISFRSACGTITDPC
jgi:hypothetical protein